MDKSVTTLTEEIKKIAERTSAVDSSVLVKQSQASGAVDTAKYIIATLLVVIGLALTGLGLVMAYQQGKHADYVPPPEGHYSGKTR